MDLATLKQEAANLGLADPRNMCRTRKRENRGLRLPSDAEAGNSAGGIEF